MNGSLWTQILGSEIIRDKTDKRRVVVISIKYATGHMHGPETGSTLNTPRIKSKL